VELAEITTLATTMTLTVTKPSVYVPPHMRVRLTAPAPQTKYVLGLSPNTSKTPSTTSTTTFTNGVGMILCAKVDGEIRYGLVKRRAGYGLHLILACLFRDTSCFQEISNEERNALLHICEMREGYSEVFQKLWAETMFHDKSGSEYPSALLRFMARKDYIRDMLLHTQPIFPFGIWGFAKGTPNTNEDDLNCALREMTEETNIRPEDVTLLSIPKQHERFKRWCYTYFVANVNVSVKHEIIPGTSEISEVRWCSLSEALHLIPDIMEEKKALLINLHKTMQPDV
jgi:ADP-ribose pyrophosphatase YjhB (NUDIX family)